LTVQAFESESPTANLVVDPGEGRFYTQPVVNVPISLLSTSGSPRVSGEDPAHIETLAATETRLPPIIVHRATMRVIDGVHRLRAAEYCGRDEIAVQFFDGPEADAFVLAVKSNIAHGLPLPLADRKHAAARIVSSHPQWSDRMITAVTGLASKTVADIRKVPAGEPDRWRSRIGQDGRVRPLDGAEGRVLAGEMLDTDPGLSLRQVARAVGISPETVRDVASACSAARTRSPAGSAGGGRLSRRSAARTGPGRSRGPAGSPRRPASLARPPCSGCGPTRRCGSRRPAGRCCACCTSTP
jgi:ParB-like nuclease family protein